MTGTSFDRQTSAEARSLKRPGSARQGKRGDSRVGEQRQGHLRQGYQRLWGMFECGMLAWRLRGDASVMITQVGVSVFYFFGIWLAVFFGMTIDIYLLDAFQVNIQAR